MGWVHPETREHIGVSLPEEQEAWREELAIRMRRRLEDAELWSGEEQRRVDRAAAANEAMVDDPAELRELPPGRTRRFLSAAELGVARPIEWLVDGWIPCGEFGVLYGQGDTYKSFTMLHWALSAAMRGKRVVYIAGEGAHGLRTRVPAWLRHHGHSVNDVPGFRVDPLPLLVDNAVETSTWLANVEDEFEQDRPDWVIIDTLAMCFSGDENTPSDMAKFIQGCEQIRRATAESPTAVTVIHHMGVTTGRERGTAALRNSTFYMIRAEHKGEKGRTVMLDCDRMKDAEKPTRIRAHLELEAWVNPDGAEVSSLAVASLEDAPKSPEDAAPKPPKKGKVQKRREAEVGKVDALAHSFLVVLKRGDVESKEKLKSKVRGDSRLKDQAIKKLLDEGRVERYKNGRKHSYRRVK